ncbi:MAG TPA: hypothetical protein ENN43_04375 [bacterium]|nr:hypothetical protein [bacterium]
MADRAVTFETKVWEGDWRFVLCTGRLEKMIKSLNYGFNEKILYINNVKDRARVGRAAEKKRRRGVIDSYVFVEDMAPDTLAHFNMTQEDFKGGYYYSIQELTGILNCRTKYLLHMAGDAMVSNREKWIDMSIDRMEKDPSIFAANPNGDPQDVMQNLVEEEEDFYRGFGFSDQCYLIRADDYKKHIYNETHEASKRFPRYGGELFEKRVDSYMRNHGLYRLTSKKALYKHRNFPADRVRRAILYITGINLKKGGNIKE